MVRVHMGTTVVVVCMTELFVSLPLSVVLTLCILSTVFPSLPQRSYIDYMFLTVPSNAVRLLFARAGL